MNDPQTVKPLSLDLEVQEIEVLARPGCNSSSTSRLCTCPVQPVTGDLFTGKTEG